MPLDIPNRISRVVSSYHFWLVVVMFVLGIVLHYPQQILGTDSPSLLASLGLTRHAVERVFFLLPVTYVGLIFGLKAGLTSLVVALAIMLPRAILISTSPPDALFETVGIIVIGGIVNLWFYLHRRDIARLERAEENLNHYLREITRAQEEERRRIARELHDDTAQDLIVLSRELDSFVVSAINHLSAEDIAYIERLRQQTEHILDGVHRFSQDLRPSVLDDLGLLPALEWLTSDLTKHFGIIVEMNVLGSARRFPPEVELVLFRIVQEALRNVWKHSGAKKAGVTLEFGDDKTILSVKDEGKGFRLPQKIDDLTVAGKLGLAGMQERARLIGGKLRLESELDQGTTVTLEVPA
jgi:two-component system sensor histidine kinase DegS